MTRWSAPGRMTKRYATWFEGGPLAGARPRVFALTVDVVGQGQYRSTDGKTYEWYPDREETDVPLPTSAAARKAVPITTGVLDYFPDAIAAVAELSRVGNEQHNPGQPLHWAREKSTDHADCIARHLLDRGRLDTDGQRHSAKVAWRALALLQLEIEDGRAGSRVDY